MNTFFAFLAALKEFLQTITALLRARKDRKIDKAVDEGNSEAEMEGTVGPSKHTGNPGVRTVYEETPTED